MQPPGILTEAPPPYSHQPQPGVAYSGGYTAPLQPSMVHGYPHATGHSPHSGGTVMKYNFLGTMYMYVN